MEKPVCKNMFASTFGIPERTVISWLREFQDGVNKTKHLTSPNSGIQTSLSNLLSEIKF
jgi:hypothetical protein